MIRFALFALAGCFAAAGAHAQCRSADRAVELKLTLGATPSETVVSQGLPVCVRHEYRLELKTGQRLTLNLTSPSGQKGMLTLVAPSGDKPADGQNEWSGTARESGAYIIEVATDRATTYTLHVSLR